MAGKYGIEGLKPIVSSIARVTNIVDGFLSGGGVWVLFGLPSALSELQSVDLNAVKQELSELDSGDRDAVQELFLGHLKLKSSKLQERVAAGVDVVSDAVGVVEDAIKVAGQAQLIWERAKLVVA